MKQKSLVIVAVSAVAAVTGTLWLLARPEAPLRTSGSTVLEISGARAGDRDERKSPVGVTRRSSVTDAARDLPAAATRDPGADLARAGKVHEAAKRHDTSDLDETPDLRANARIDAAFDGYARAALSEATRALGDGSEGTDPDALEDSAPSAAERAAEPDDIGWSVHMEQTLEQYLAAHPQASEFALTSIDCRTSYCEIRAFGIDESTQPLWQQVIFEIRNQPWSEFGVMGTSADQSDGRLSLTATLGRVRADP